MRTLKKIFGTLFKSLFPMDKLSIIWGTTKPFVFHRILLERITTGFALVVGIGRSTDAGRICHRVVITPVVIFFL